MADKFNLKQDYNAYRKISVNKGPEREYIVFEKKITEKCNSMNQHDRTNLKHCLKSNERCMKTCHTSIHGILMPLAVAFLALLIAVFTLLPAIMQPMRNLLLETMKYADAMEANNAKIELIENNASESDIAMIIGNMESANFRKTIQEIAKYTEQDAEGYFNIGFFIIIVLVLFGVLFSFGVFYFRKKEAFYKDYLKIVERIHNQAILSSHDEDSENEELLIAEYRQLSPSLKNSIYDIVTNLKK